MIAGERTVEAVVQTGWGETPYRRSGRGAPVLLLGADTALLGPLAARFRVIAPLRLPDPTNDATVLAEWLRGVVEGLGLERPAIVAGEAWLAAAVRVAAADPDRLGPVVEAGTVGAVLDRLDAEPEARGIIDP